MKGGEVLKFRSAPEQIYGEEIKDDRKYVPYDDYLEAMNLIEGRVNRIKESMENIRYISDAYDDVVELSKDLY